MGLDDERRGRERKGDRKHVLASRLRTGDLSREDLVIAAQLGDPDAIFVHGKTVTSVISWPAECQDFLQDVFPQPQDKPRLVSYVLAVIDAIPRYALKNSGSVKSEKTIKKINKFYQISKDAIAMLKAAAPDAPEGTDIHDQIRDNIQYPLMAAGNTTNTFGTIACSDFASAISWASIVILDPAGNPGPENNAQEGEYGHLIGCVADCLAGMMLGCQKIDRNEIFIEQTLNQEINRQQLLLAKYVLGEL